MKLTITDRLSLVFLYPRESTLINQLLVKDIRLKTEITKEEITKIDLKSLPNGSVTWDEKLAKDVVITIDLTQAEVELLRSQIALLDKSKKITYNMKELCLKIKEYMGGGK